jgi:bifunctional DNase/RNase
MLVVETFAGDRALGFHVPPNEAGRLARVLGLGRCRCAPVFDLVHQVAASLGGRVAGAVLDAEEGGICARLIVASAGAEIGIPCHPADAVGLAVQSDTPIHVTPTALARATPAGVASAHAPGGLAAWLEDVRPADFGQAPRANRRDTGGAA